MDAQQHDSWLALNLVPGLGPTLLGRCLRAFGSAQQILAASTAQLSAVEGIGAKRSGELRRQIDQLNNEGALEREKQLIEQFNVSLYCIDDETYPKLLRHIHDPPPLLYVRGQLLAQDAVALAIVGARRCTHYGREQADRLATLCCNSGLTIVSGGAYGIDAACHTAAVNADGRTIAVLGNGLAEPYPKPNGPLFDKIADGRGAVISELPMSFPPMAENFPRRNRIISGLALGVLVIEASSRSGAMITARWCAEDHGREVMALPGRVDSPASAGCHKMIRQGWATLVTSSGDILDALGETGQLLKGAMSSEPQHDDEPANLFEQNLTDTQRRILDALAEPGSLDQIAAGADLSVQDVQADLTLLQIRGVVEKTGSTWQRKR
jgi:DNA processing protein